MNNVVLPGTAITLGIYHIIPSTILKEIVVIVIISGVARAFPGGRVAHPEGQNEEENEKSLRKSKKNWSKFQEKMRKVELLPTLDCEAGYGPGDHACQILPKHKTNN